MSGRKLERKIDITDPTKWIITQLQFWDEEQIFLIRRAMITIGNDAATWADDDLRAISKLAFDIGKQRRVLRTLMLDQKKEEQLSVNIQDEMYATIGDEYGYRLSQWKDLPQKATVYIATMSVLHWEDKGVRFVAKNVPIDV